MRIIQAPPMIQAPEPVRFSDATQNLNMTPPQLGPVSFQSMEPVNQQKELAAAIANNAINGGPARGGIGEVLARLGQAFIARYMMQKSNKEADTNKEINTQAIRDAMRTGDVLGLLHSDDPVAQHLGQAMLTSQFSEANKNEYQTLSPDEIRSMGYDPSTVNIQKDRYGKLYITQLKDDVPPGYRKDDKGNQVFIPGGPADPNNALNRQKFGLERDKLDLDRQKMNQTLDPLGLGANPTSQPWTLKW